MSKSLILASINHFSQQLLVFLGYYSCSVCFHLCREKASLPFSLILPFLLPDFNFSGNISKLRLRYVLDLTACRRLHCDVVDFSCM